MASIFSFDPDPPRVSSPWEQVSDAVTRGARPNGVEASDVHNEGNAVGSVTRLQPEPQEGPVEYKLHLLLRPRRKFHSISNGTHISGSKRTKNSDALAGRKPSGTALEQGPSSPSSASVSASAAAASTQQTRQHRLQQLTTQLLWRLQQSSPHHSSSATNVILPTLPEALPELRAPQHIAKLQHGLEESRGALYEIGVLDDGTLVGLAEDELQESLNNLRAMAACLGCTVEVLLKRTVGECEWSEESNIDGVERTVKRIGALVVAEARVKPVLHAKRLSATHEELALNASSVDRGVMQPTTAQLRVTLTGPTMSGKSTLLGTLTLSVLDNGRGETRLSTLKHRHEITSGRTSSVTQELVGYSVNSDGNVKIANYATEEVESWNNIHTTSAGGRLVLISDSAGHPRYKRTTLKGLVGWAPHWTLLCVPANDAKVASHPDIGSTSWPQSSENAMLEMDLSGAQLELCLRLSLPLVIVITKLDQAAKTDLVRTLTKVLDTLKAAGRKPAILPSSEPASVDEMQIIRSPVIDAASEAARPLLNHAGASDARYVVPIVLTSAVDGRGISNLHALLHGLPIPRQSANAPITGQAIFDIEDVYHKPSVIVSGRLRSGQIAAGDIVAIGPFSSRDFHDDSEDSDERPRRKSATPQPTSRSFPGALRNSHSRSAYLNVAFREWQQVKVVGVRNLKLPVASLGADQAGTVEITLHEDGDEMHGTRAELLTRLRKGMVLASMQPMACRSFSARFKREDLESLAVGNHVVVYISSVRASARIVSARTPDSVPSSPNERADPDDHEPFALDDVQQGFGRISAKVAGLVTAPELLVTFSLDASKEFVVVGDQVLVMPGGGPGLYGGQERGEKGIAGLEGFVGMIDEVRG